FVFKQKTAYEIGFDIANQFSDPPYTWGGFAWIMYTTDNGCGPGAGGDAGTMIDDVWFEGVDSSPIERGTWTGIKDLYR
ncbi:MAG: hypothetical protein JXB46_01950, partial [Candidatus Eisenbacteria bacterium]|nr:hypothetical protein [Candidatus Eisenbacteria bacterium]